VMRLIDERLDVNEADALGHTPLHVAAGSEEPNSGCLCECDFLGLVSYTAACAWLCTTCNAGPNAHTDHVQSSVTCVRVSVCLSVYVCLHHGGVLITHRRGGSAAL